MTAGVWNEAAELKMRCCVEHNQDWEGGLGGGPCTDTEMDSKSRAHALGGGSSARGEDAEGVSAANDTLERLVLP